MEITVSAGFTPNGLVDIDGVLTVSQAAGTGLAKQGITIDADVKANEISLTKNPWRVKFGTDTSGKPSS
jgi:hypothetical protein